MPLTSVYYANINRFVDPSGFAAAPPPAFVTVGQRAAAATSQLDGPEPGPADLIAIGELTVVYLVWDVVEFTNVLEAKKQEQRTGRELEETQRGIKERNKPLTIAPNPAEKKPVVAFPHEVKLDPNSIQNSQGDPVKSNQNPNQEGKDNAPKQDANKDQKKDDAGAKDSKDAASKKASSPGKMQKEVERDQAPDEVIRVDRAHVEGQQPHVHYDDGTSSNQDGSTHDQHKGTPNPSNKTRSWLKDHNWTPPPKPEPPPERDPNKK